MRLPFIIIPLLAAGCGLASARAVSGIVVDNAGEPVIGANIDVKGDSVLSAVTDLDGKFSFSDLPPKSVISVSYIGFAPCLVRLSPKKDD
ncbi:MAG: carboxypeptidase-like regulatory domain-containing protein, partial [Duncaniella sp.]|nr:carboxypeptidase-like regulatory domain-containing protein [Duncaniella sp.]